MKRTIAATGAVSLALLLGACGTSTTATNSTSTPMTASTSTAMTPSSTTTMTSSSTSAAASVATADIVDTAIAAGSFKTLTTALTAAGLVNTLKGAGPFTVFAPTDAAFGKLPAGTLATLLKNPKGKLAQILTYHVVAGKFLAADVVKLNGHKLTTVEGAKLTIEVSGGKVALVDATGKRVNIVTTDVMASNGVIHVIDAVLMPTK